MVFREWQERWTRHIDYAERIRFLHAPYFRDGIAWRVLGVFPLQNDRLFTFDDIAGMETLASLLASALSRVRRAKPAHAMLVKKSDASTTIFAETWANAAPTITDDMTKSILPLEAQTYQKTVVPFEAVASGTNPHRLPSSISQCIDRSVALAHEELRQHTLILNVPSDLPDVLIDPPLIDQALVTFL